MRTSLQPDLVGLWALIIYHRLDRVHRSLDTNLFGSLKVTRAVLGIMREQKSGVVGFIGSVVSSSSSKHLAVNLLRINRADGPGTLHLLPIASANSL